MELEQLTPIPTNELEQAADMLANFRKHWERLEGDEESRHDLVGLIVERVYVEDERVVAMTLRSNYHLILNHKANEPTEFSVDSRLFAGGSDGGGALTCKKLIIAFLPRYINNHALSSRWLDIASQKYKFTLGQPPSEPQKQPVLTP